MFPHILLVWRFTKVKALSVRQIRQVTPIYDEVREIMMQLLILLLLFNEILVRLRLKLLRIIT